MAATALGLFLGGSVTAIPVVTGVAEGVSHQKKQNEEANNETRMHKFNIDIECESGGSRAKELDGGIVVLRHDKVRTTVSPTSLPTPVTPCRNHSIP